VTDTTGSLANGIVDVEVWSSGGQKVGQQFFSGQNLSPGQTASFSYSWTAPPAAGTYAVKIGVFGPNWSPLLFWANSAATISVQ